MDELTTENITIVIEQVRRRKKGVALRVGDRLLHSDYINPLSAKERSRFVDDAVWRHRWLSDRRDWLDQTIAEQAVSQMA